MVFRLLPSARFSRIIPSMACDNFRLLRCGDIRHPLCDWLPTIRRFPAGYALSEFFYTREDGDMSAAAAHGRRGESSRLRYEDCREDSVGVEGLEPSASRTRTVRTPLLCVV